MGRKKTDLALHQDIYVRDVSPETRRLFKAACALQDRTMKEVFHGLLAAYIRYAQDLAAIADPESTLAKASRDVLLAKLDPERRKALRKLWADE